MEKLRWLDRILLGRAFTIFMNLVALALVVPITAVLGNNFLSWVSATVMAGHDDLLHAALQSQAAVGVVLVSLGVVLEGRGTFVVQVTKVYAVSHLPGQEEFNSVCELFGFYILVLGLLIECAGELVHFVHFGSLSLPLFGGVSIVLNVISVGFLLRLIVLVWRLRLA